MTRLLIAFLLASIGTLVAGCTSEPPAVCVEWRVEHRPAWTQIMSTGRILVPIHHPARAVSVCARHLPQSTTLGDRP